MKVIITGSTGMVGKGVLYECLDHPDVEKVLVVNRSSLGMEHKKLQEVLTGDLMNLNQIESELGGYDACFFCAGISSFRMSEADFTRITYDLTLHFAKTVLFLNPNMIFTYVSGAGTDSTEKGSTMWARVKGKTENDLMKLGFKRSYMFRPGYIQPMRGLRSKTPLYNFAYFFVKPFYPLFKSLTPGSVTNTITLGKAMIACVKNGYEKSILDPKDINQLGDSLN